MRVSAVHAQANPHVANVKPVDMVALTPIWGVALPVLRINIAKRSQDKA